MNKAYNKIIWQNKPSTATPLNQTNLNEMSNALDTIDDRVIALDNGKVSSVTVTNTLQTGDTIATITVDGTATNIKSAQVVVDSTPSATSENPLQNKAIYEMLNEILPEETAEGNPISISDASGLNAKACSVDLLPIQDLHGYDSPWVGGAGKNKIVLKDYTASGNGVTITSIKDDDGNVIGYDLDGTATAGQDFYINFGAINLPSQTWYATVGTDTYVGVQLVLTPSYTGIKPSGTYNGSITSCYVGVANGTVCNHLKIYPMICDNAITDKSFAPYSNICPISGRTEASVTRTGKNLVDIDKIVEGKMLTTTDGTLENGTNKLYVTDYIYVVKGVPVFIPATGTSRRWFYDLNKVGSVYINYAYQQAYIPPENGYIRVTATTDIIAKDELQIEYGTTASTYEPYQGKTVTVQFGQTVYGGKPDVTNGKLPIDKEYRLFNGTENWQVSGTGTDHYFYNINLGSATYAVQGDIISDKFETASVSQYNTTVGTIFCTPQYIRIRPFSTELSVSDWKTWLQSNNVQVVFGIQTPIEITLTPEEISLLKGNNVISTDGDNIILKYSADIGLYIAGQLQS